MKSNKITRTVTDNMETAQAVEPPPVGILQQCFTLKRRLATLKDDLAAIDRILQSIKNDIATRKGQLAARR